MGSSCSGTSCDTPSPCERCGGNRCIGSLSVQEDLRLEETAERPEPEAEPFAPPAVGLKRSPSEDLQALGEISAHWALQDVQRASPHMAQLSPWPPQDLPSSSLKKKDCAVREQAGCDSILPQKLPSAEDQASEAKVKPQSLGGEKLERSGGVQGGISGVFQKILENALEAEGSESTEEAEQPVNASKEFWKCLIADTIMLVASLLVMVAIFVMGRMEERLDCEDADPLLRSCQLCGEGTITLPLGSNWEKRWPVALRIVHYAVWLIWLFVGVTFVCDEFMAAIETITSTTKPVWVTDGVGQRHQIQVKVWNDTVANLTLMALGSSAPEILLSAIEVVVRKFFAGNLGPSTIVGSAAFNLFSITAVCVGAIPAPDVRKIEKTRVFTLTACVSVFAYLWILVILLGSSPEKVDLWEGCATLGFFFVLLIAAFLIDRSSTTDDSSDEINEEEKLLKIRNEMLQSVQQSCGTKEVSLDHVQKTLDALDKEAKKEDLWTRAKCRRLNTQRLVPARNSQVLFGFGEMNYLVMECVGKAALTVKPSSPFPYPVTLRYETREGQAKAGVRFEHTEGELHFSAFELSKELHVDIIDNDFWDPSEEFYVQLSDLRVIGGADDKDVRAKLSNSSCAVVWVINDEEPGTLDFQVSEVVITEAPSEACLTVKRSIGFHGDIVCDFETVEDTAVGCEHFTPVKGSIKFAEGEATQSITIPILKLPAVAKEQGFKVRLKNPSQGVFFSPFSAGGYDSSVCQVVLCAQRPKSFFSCAYLFQGSLASALPRWREKLPEALYCNGSAQEQARAGIMDWIIHLTALSWKVLFIIVPPAELLGGWPAFFVALAMIGGVTCLINDAASLLGCSLGMPDYITAITFVALGTSLPDTMASRTAAMMQSTADDAIGNVTGSNSVNVFLGLGISWTMAALYWNQVGPTEEWLSMKHDGRTYEELFSSTYPDGGFIVPPGSLGTSVAVFSAGALLCLSLLALRRRLYGGELGGPRFAQIRDSSLLFGIWLSYIAISIAYGVLTGQT